MLRFILLFPVLLLPFLILGQQNKKPAFNKWVLTQNGLLDHTGGTPTYIDNPIPGLVGGVASASYCDVNGNVLFHSNNRRMFKRNNTFMDNGVFGDISMSNAEGPLFVPFINNPDKYHVFRSTKDANANFFTNETLRYYVIDVTADGGFGEIVLGESDIELADSICGSTVGAMHEDKRDFWIITKVHYPDGAGYFLSFLVTEDGVCPTPVVSSVGFINVNTVPRSTQLAISADEKQIAVKGAGTVPAQLFDFNNCTGKVTYATDINNGDMEEHDIAFSPDDQLIYITGHRTQSIGGSPVEFPHIAQYRRLDAAGIPATEFIIGGVRRSDPTVVTDTTQNGEHFKGMRCYGDTMFIATDAGIHLLTTPNDYGAPGLERYWHFNNFTVNRYVRNFPPYFDYQQEIVFQEPYTFIPNVEVCSSEAPFRLGNLSRCTSEDFTYTWSPTIGLDDPTAQSPTLDPSAISGSSITYTVTVDFLGCITESDTIKVTVTPTNYPPTPVIEICAGDSALIFGNQETDAGTYRDTIESTCTINSVELLVSDSIRIHDTITICQGDSALIEGTYYKASIVLSDTVDCMVTFTHLVVVPTSSSFETVSICDEDSALIHGAFENVAGTYTQINNCDTSNIALEVIPINTTNSTEFICEGESYELENISYTTSQTILSSTDANCNRQQIELIVYQLPSVSIDVEHDLCSEGRGKITTAIVSGEAPYTYSWNTGDTTASVESLTTGTYTLTINDGNDCSNTQTIEIENVCDAAPIYFPKAFTPNGDGVNETFGPVFHNSVVVEELSFFIFDRWGGQLFFTQIEGVEWDGTFKGVIVPSGLYNYVAEIKQENENSEVLSGTVNLLR